MPPIQIQLFKLFILREKTRDYSSPLCYTATKVIVTSIVYNDQEINMKKF